MYVCVFCLCVVHSWNNFKGKKLNRAQTKTLTLPMKHKEKVCELESPYRCMCKCVHMHVSVHVYENTLCIFVLFDVPVFLSRTTDFTLKGMVDK